MLISLICNYLKKIFRSKSRTILTLSGLVLSVFILVSVLVIIETGFDMAMHSVNTYRNCNGVVVNGELQYEDYKKIADSDVYETRFEIVEYTSAIMKVLEDKNDNEVNVFGQSIQVDGNFDLNMTHIDRYSSERYKSELLYGRLIGQEDIDKQNKVVIIDESLAKILFNKVNAVGETVKIRANNIDGSTVFANYKVVGVIEASVQSKENYAHIIERLSCKSEDSGIISFNFFIPYTAAYNPYNGENGEMAVICQSDSTDYKSIGQHIRLLNLSKSAAIIDGDVIYAEIAAQIEDSRTTMMYAMFFVFVISGLSIMNTTMFSVKERINEIGIRKAIGAFNSDIITQFVFEGLVYGVISGVIGTFISTSALSVGFLLLKDSLVGATRLVISTETVVLAITLSIIVGIVSSLVPAIYASKIKISEALKFD